MILDLSDCDIIYDADIDPDATPLHSNVIPIRLLTKEKWVVILTTEAPTVHNDELTDYHYDSSITTRIKLHEDKYIWIVPLTSLVAPCFVVYNKNYNGSNIEDNNMKTNGQLIFLSQ